MSTEPEQVRARSSSPGAERMRLYRKRRREGMRPPASRPAAGSKIDENRQIDGSRHMAKGQKTGGRQKGSRNKRKQEREEATAQAVALIGEAIHDAFPGDAHAFLVAVYKNPRQSTECCP